MGRIIQCTRKRKDGSSYVEDTYTLLYYDPVKGYTVKESTGLKATGEGSKNWKKAEAVLRSREHAKDEGLPIMPKATKTTMDELFDMVVTSYKNKGNRSLDHVERKLKLYLREFFGKRKAIA